MKKKVSKEMSIAELVEEHPEIEDLLEEKGMFCASCVLAKFDKVGNGAVLHGMDPEKLLEDINNRIEEVHK